MFRRDLSPDGLRPDLPLPLHMEVLIDRQGYVRARQIRWLPGQGGPWDEPATLLETVARLAAEPPTARPPDEHVH
jgi:hypothetical protein